MINILDYCESKFDEDFSKNTRSLVKKFGFAILKKAFRIKNRDQHLATVTSLRELRCLDTPNSRPSTLPSTFLWKTNIGDSDPTLQRFPRCFETFYIPRADRRFEGFDEMFKVMIDFRNCLLMQPKNYVRSLDKAAGLWSACRLQHYFRGGGFFGGHRDVIIEDISTATANYTIQLIGVLSKRGRDFESGGAYLKQNDRLIDLEEMVDIGDIIVYDGASFHGVNEIDPGYNLSLSPDHGRWSSLVSLYKVQGS